MEIAFTVYGEPKGKGRPKFSKVGNYVKVRTPEDTVIYENLVRMEFKNQCGNKRFEDGSYLNLNVDAYFAIPKSASKKKRGMMISGEIRPTKKPDLDNILKAIADSLNELAYKDDAQIVDISIKKFYSTLPRVDIIIKEID